jgi:hypothetical protein
VSYRMSKIKLKKKVKLEKLDSANKAYIFIFIISGDTIRIELHTLRVAERERDKINVVYGNILKLHGDITQMKNEPRDKTN